MSDGLSYYYESLEEQRQQKCFEKFKEVDTHTIYEALKSANDSVYRLTRSDPSLTKTQHDILDNIEKSIKKALGLRLD